MEREENGFFFKPCICFFKGHHKRQHFISNNLVAVPDLVSFDTEPIPQQSWPWTRDLPNLLVMLTKIIKANADI